MKKVIHKWFWAWDFDKEEKWLNEMAAKGLALHSVGFCKYIFEDCLPGEYNVRLELLDWLPSHEGSRRYIEFVEETGAEHIGSVTRWVYFRKKTEDGSFDLFSDNASRLVHLKRICTLLAAVALSTIPSGFYNLILGFSFHSPLNFVAGCVGLIGILALYFAVFKVGKKIRLLKQEQQIFE